MTPGDDFEEKVTTRHRQHHAKRPEPAAVLRDQTSRSLTTEDPALSLLADPEAHQGRSAVWLFLPSSPRRYSCLRPPASATRLGRIQKPAPETTEEGRWGSKGRGLCALCSISARNHVLYDRDLHSWLRGDKPAAPVAVKPANATPVHRRPASNFLRRTGQGGHGTPSKPPDHPWTGSWQLAGLTATGAAVCRSQP